VRRQPVPKKQTTPAPHTARYSVLTEPEDDEIVEESEAKQCCHDDTVITDLDVRSVVLTTYKHRTLVKQAIREHHGQAKFKTLTAALQSPEMQIEQDGMREWLCMTLSTHMRHSMQTVLAKDEVDSKVQKLRDLYVHMKKESHFVRREKMITHFLQAEDLLTDSVGFSRFTDDLQYRSTFVKDSRTLDRYRKMVVMWLHEVESYMHTVTLQIDERKVPYYARYVWHDAELQLVNAMISMCQKSEKLIGSLGYLELKHLEICMLKVECSMRSADLARLVPIYCKCDHIVDRVMQQGKTQK
jgi:hypothetical protein